MIAMVVTIGLVTLVVLAVVPVSQTTDVSFSFSNSSTVLGIYYTNFTASYTGTLDFSWSTSPNGAARLTISNPSNATLYSDTSNAGSGTIDVVAGATYSFGLYALSYETVDVSGTLHYSSPLI
ncbi:MAG: hypothetical protein ACLQD9_07020 [Thermoplasmata archaeon]|nr:hypothetical protein [Thermoplasmata archaeon]